MSSKVMKPRRRGAVLRPVTVAAIVALLSGCYSYRIEHVANPVKLPPAWDAEGSANTKPGGVAKDWWKGFHSTVLEGLIDEAQRNNPSIIGTEERLKQAERSFQVSTDSLGIVPDVSVSASTSKGVSGSIKNPDTFLGPGQDDARVTQSTSLSASSSYTVDLWGATAARYRNNLANFIGTKYDADLARIQLSANIARQYFSLLQTRSSVDVARRNLTIAEEVLRITKARYDNDLVRQFDLTQQEITVQQQRNALIPRENSMRRQETALGLLLGKSPQEFHLEGEPIGNLAVPEIAPWLPSELLLRRPDMAGAELDMATAKANVVIARAALIPVSLSLSASVSKSSQDLLQLTDPTSYSLSAALRLAEGIFSHRSRKIAVINAKSNEYLALVNYASTIRSALKDVDDALAAVKEAELSEESQQRTLVQTRRSYDLANVEFREGSANRQDLLDAQRQLFSAEDSALSARVTRLNAALTLYVALGGGWDGPGPEMPPVAAK